jgi:hypothetical protein
MLKGERDWAPVELHHLDVRRRDRARVLESRRSQLATLDVRRHAAFGLVTLVEREVLLVSKQDVECLALLMMALTSPSSRMNAMANCLSSASVQ